MSVIFHLIVLAILALVIRPPRDWGPVPAVSFHERPGDAVAARWSTGTLDLGGRYAPATRPCADRWLAMLNELPTGLECPEDLILGPGPRRWKYPTDIAVASGLFGVPTRTKGQPDALRIVYVVDRSGSMAETFDFVRQELLSAVDALSESQCFHVILFSQGTPKENPPRRLVPANSANKQALRGFLEHVIPERNTVPGPAMKRAFQVTTDDGKGAQLIYFLTDGEFQVSLLDNLRVWNSGRGVRINTICFLFDSGAPLLQKIAADHHGQYKFVSRYELGLRGK